MWSETDAAARKCGNASLAQAKLALANRKAEAANRKAEAAKRKAEAAKRKTKANGWCLNRDTRDRLADVFKQAILEDMDDVYVSAPRRTTTHTRTDGSAKRQMANKPKFTADSSGSEFQTSEVVVHTTNHELANRVAIAKLLQADRDRRERRDAEKVEEELLTEAFLNTEAELEVTRRNVQIAEDAAFARELRRCETLHNESFMDHKHRSKHELEVEAGLDELLAHGLALHDELYGSGLNQQQLTTLIAHELQAREYELQKNLRNVNQHDTCSRTTHMVGWQFAGDARSAQPLVMA